MSRPYSGERFLNKGRFVWFRVLFPEVRYLLLLDEHHAAGVGYVQGGQKTSLLCYGWRSRSSPKAKLILINSVVPLVSWLLQRSTEIRLPAGQFAHPKAASDVPTAPPPAGWPPLGLRQVYVGARPGWSD